MLINRLLEEKHLTKYSLSKQSGVPYATLNDLCSGKSNLSKSSADTVFRLAKALQVTMEELIEPYMKPRVTFDLYKSNVCHRLKELGDVEFLIETIRSDEISDYYERKWYPECFYLLAMLDYISRVNEVPLCEDYNRFRSMKLKTMLYPSSLLGLSAATKNDNLLEYARREAIPEFLQFNIVEGDVRNVI